MPTNIELAQMVENLLERVSAIEKEFDAVRRAISRGSNERKSITESVGSALQEVELVKRGLQAVQQEVGSVKNQYDMGVSRYE